MRVLLLQTDEITVHITVTNKDYDKFNKSRYVLKRYVDHIFVTENGWTDRGWFNMYRYGKNFNLQTKGNNSNSSL